MRSNFNMSFDPVLKKEFAEVVSDYGLTVPQAFKLFANQVVKTQSIPLDFSWRANQNDQINDTVLEILKQNMLEQAQGNSTQYANFDEMMADLNRRGRACPVSTKLTF